GQEADVDLGSGAEHVVVRRQAGNVELNLIDASASSLATHLDDAKTLAEAVEALESESADDPSFDLATALQRLTSAGLLSGFTLARATHRYYPTRGPST
ncbi:MAG: hypothetical protein V3S67_05910, partial [Gammaproteobacteria bacterium]